ncbi:acyloxyacyl hydrolase [Bacteroides sp. 51]|uniref:acyloxyacyl hydrolase n=1 Tax=Bacteroides sp. 51 TaxID=2302938 RepID=UPI0013D41F17|nr:acyloxyacyl hydrolase [Bacteroides sp. 51]NDV83689.1 hypothetical protein [Bacteroides sp. 51]
MKKRASTFLFIILYCLSSYAGDSIKSKFPHYLAVNAADGLVFPTNKFVSGDYRIPHYTAFTLKYGITSKGDNWKDYAYGLPTMGIGLYVANFYRNHDLGTPFSLFLFQGATLHQFKPKLSLNYEWNLGASFNWKHYDAFDNPDNIALGSSVNVHVGGNLFLKWRLSKRWDLSTGLGFTHFSNGASSLPNRGLNMANAFVELAYYFNREEPATLLSNPHPTLAFKKKINHDFMLLISSREATVDTTGTGLASPYTDRRFKVLGLSYAYMINSNYRYKWGPSIEATYDESSGITSWREEHPETHKMHDRTKMGKVKDRFSVGLSLKGEMSMPGYSVFANLGYDVIHGNKKDERLYQILGVKIFLQDNLFGTFGIRATNFGSAQYLFWNLGYTFEQEKKRRKKL